jgi:hypothetical protein
MSKRSTVQSVVFALMVAILTTGFGWAFNGEVFAHELDRKHHALSSDRAALIEAHEFDVFTDSKHVDAAINLCLHAAGQYEPFFLMFPPLVPVSFGMETLASFISFPFPESIPDSLLRPPRNTSIG